MNAYRIRRGATLAGLQQVTDARRALAPDEVRVAMSAVALNHRDLLVAAGSMGTTSDPIVPASDGVGRVVETGSAVTRWRAGDRVIASFFPDWIDGAPTAATTARGLGGGRDGVLAREVVLPEHAWFAAPQSLGDIEAATLACAGVAAWNALFEAGGARAAQTVVLLGTGGVSTWALQLAKAAGLRAIVASSSAAKRAQAETLGADATIDYVAEPAWDARVRELTAGVGADLVLDVGGAGTMQRSIAATRVGGTVAVVGGLGGGFASEVDGAALMGGAKRLVGVLVGNRAMGERLAAFVDAHGIRPVVDHVFPFDRVREAYEHLARGAHVGKVVVAIDAATPAARAA